MDFNITSKLAIQFQIWTNIEGRWNFSWKLANLLMKFLLKMLWLLLTSYLKVYLGWYPGALEGLPSSLGGSTYCGVVDFGLTVVVETDWLDCWSQQTRELPFESSGHET